MSNRLIPLLVLQCMIGGALNADEGKLSTIDPDYFTVEPGEVAGSYTPWAIPLRGGAVRAWLIGSLQNGLEYAHLQRRLELHATTTLVKPTIALPEGAIGYPPLNEGHYNNVSGFSQSDMTTKLLEASTGDHEVVVIGNVDWSILPEEVRSRIESKIKAGAGLILAHQSSATIELWQARLAETESLAMASRDLPLAEATRLIGEEASDQGRGEDRRIEGRFGEGRVSILQWSVPQGDATEGLALASHALTTIRPLTQYTRDGWAYEYELATIIQAMLWAAKRDDGQRITWEEIPRDAAEGDHVDIRLSLDPTIDASHVALDFRFRSTENATVQQGRLTAAADAKNRVAYRIPRPATRGVYGLDLRVLEGDGVIGFAGQILEISGESRIDSLQIDTPSGTPLGPIHGKVKLHGAPPGAVVRVQATDSYQRLVSEQLYRYDGEAPIDFHLTPSHLLGHYLRIRASLVIDDVVLDQKSSDFLVDRRVSQKDDYLAVVWHDIPSDYLTSTHTAALRNVGFDVLYHPHYFEYPLDHLRRGSWEVAKTGMQVAPYIWRDYAYAKADVNDLHREPCLSSPLYHQSMETRLKPYAELASEFAAPYASLGDEPYLVHYWDGVNGRDVCFAPDCQASFRVYLKEIYGTLAKLNRQWETRFKTWDEVGPVVYQETLASDNFSRWIDHRQHMAEVLGRMWERESSLISGIDPQIPAGPEGMFPWDPFKGYDFMRMSRLGFVGPYGTAHGESTQLQSAQIAAFRRGGDNKRLMSFTGWYNTMPRSREYSWSDVWWPMLQGYNGLMYFSGNAGSTMSGVTPDYRPLMYMRDTMLAMREIRGGIFDVVRNADIQNGEIGILYSPTSYLASSILRGELGEPLSIEQSAAWMRLLNDIGLPHTHVSTEQVEDGELAKGVLKTLILPAAISLSEREVAEIREFVNRGGTIVADVIPGLMDGHGRRLPKGALDDVFGVRHRDWLLAALPYPADSSPAHPAKEYASDLRLAGAARLRSTPGGHPLFLSNRFGEGVALLTNTTMRGYPSSRAIGRHHEMATTIKQWFVEAGIKGRFGLRSTDPQEVPTVELVPYRDGGLEYLAVVKQPKYAKPGPSPFIVTLAESSHIYDVRAGTYLGRSDQLSGACSGADPHFYALLLYRVEAMDVQVATRGIEQGHAVELIAKVKAAGVPEVGRHILRIEVASPLGQTEHYKQTVVANAGEASISIPLALNDPVGAWGFTVTDVATGTTAHGTFECVARKAQP